LPEKEPEPILQPIEQKPMIESNMKYYNTEEVAKIMGVNYMTILRLIQRNKLKANKIGSRFRIPASEVIRLGTP
jgi:excisionase family DNA binding protein